MSEPRTLDPASVGKPRLAKRRFGRVLGLLGVTAVGIALASVPVWSGASAESAVAAIERAGKGPAGGFNPNSPPPRPSPEGSSSSSSEEPNGSNGGEEVDEKALVADILEDPRIISSRLKLGYDFDWRFMQTCNGGVCSAGGTTDLSTARCEDPMLIKIAETRFKTAAARGENELRRLGGSILGVSSFKTALAEKSKLICDSQIKISVEGTTETRRGRFYMRLFSGGRLTMRLSLN